jgi:predicted aminopeptidase
MPRRGRPLHALAALSALALGSVGCSGALYVAQAARGELEILSSERPIAQVVRDEETPPRTAALLAEVGAIKRFGERQGLKPTTSYGSYVELDRPAAVWVVSASAPLSFQSKWWRFPFVGQINYLGWFERDDAEVYAERLRAAGWDADMRGASAYSTLGWFSDPVLSSMISPDDDALGELASTVLHESVHATVYLPGATELNESLAEVAGEALAGDYLDARKGPRSPEKLAFVARQRAYEARSEAMRRAYERLDAVYRSAKPAAAKLAEKAAVLSALEAETGVTGSLNNATLIQYRTYDGGAEEIEALYGACGRAWPRFFRAVEGWVARAAGARGREEPRAGLRRLAREGCR